MRGGRDSEEKGCKKRACFEEWVALKLVYGIKVEEGEEESKDEEDEFEESDDED